MLRLFLWLFFDKIIKYSVTKCHHELEANRICFKEDVITFLEAINEAHNDGSLVTEFHGICRGLRSPSTLLGNRQGKCRSILH